ncbi:unnamed protein product [Macrosiphum euphorbiae]|uniref:THAP-type domain-containing protein n=1 Tax=Macrosiphum euphorbiae TaxID=13131 RepID=A0AAV0WWS2_9HEMI|nr:unnamed protein product [Macrosiphum euphorbiae]
MAPKKCTIACVFCLSTQYKNPSISLHSFPKDQSRQSLWLTACGLTEDDYKPSRKLCSQHFDQDCFKTGTTLNILKPNSVPTKFNKHSKEFFISTSFRKDMAEMSSPEVIYQIDDQAVSTVKFETVSNYEIETAYNCEIETAYNCEMETVSNYEMETVSNYEIESVSNCEMETAYNCETSQMYGTS